MLTSITLKGFRNHSHTEITLAPFTLFLGPNGAGKTSILDALTWALLGAGRLTTASGAGADLMRSPDVHEMSVSVDVEGWGKIGRALNKRQTLSLSQGDAGSVAANQATILQRFGAPHETLLALLDPKPLVNRPPNEQKEILLKVLRPPNIEPTQILLDAGIDSIASIEQLNRLVGDWKDGKLRDLNREKKKLEAQEIIPPRWPLPKEWSRETVTDLLKKVREKKQKLAGEEAVCRAVIQDDEKRLTEVDKPIFGLLSDERANFARNKAEHHRKSIGLLQAALQEVEDAHRRAELDHRAHLQTTIRVEGEIRGLQAKKIEKHCETCQCPIDMMRAELAAQIKILDADLQAARNVAEEANDARNTTGTRAAQLRRELADVQAELTGIQQELTRHAAALEAQENAPKREPREATERRLQESRERLAGIERQYKELDLEIAKGEQCLTAIQQYERDMKEGQDFARRFQKLLHEDIPAVQRVVDELIWLRQEIIQQGIEPFLETMDRILGNFALPGVNYNQDIGFSWDKLPLSALSAGQSAMFFEAAFRIAAARRANFPLIVLDQMAPVDDDNRVRLMRLLAQSGVQALVAWTTHFKPEPKPDLSQTTRRYWITSQEGVANVQSID